MSFGKSKDDKEPSTGIPSGIPSGIGGITPIGQGRMDSRPDGRPEAFLGKGCKIVGTLTFAGPVEVEGNVEGEIIAQDRLIVGESAVIKGKITGGEIVIKGEIQGDIVATKRLNLKRPARIIGNITAAVLSIDEGVVFEGKCQMNIGASSAGTGKNEGRGALVALAEKVA